MRTAARALSAVALGVGLFGSGYVLGQNKWYAWGNEHLQNEVTGRLSTDVIAVTYLQEGNPEAARKVLERHITAAIFSLAENQPDAAASSSVGKVLGLAKAYRTVYPGSQRDPREKDVLSEARVPAPSACDPALRRLLERAAPASR